MSDVQRTTISIGGYQFPVSVATSKLLYFSDHPTRAASVGITISFTVKSSGQINAKQLPPDEPSTITPHSPIQKPDDINLVPQLGYFPSYAQCSAEQRWIYLNWLGNVSEPIQIGYAFIYYYGLERRLLTDEFDLAFEEILRLRKFHNHPSFVGYSTDALLQACILKKRYDRMHYVLYPAIWREQENTNLFVAYLLGADIVPESLISVGQYISGVNKRYIQNEPALFESVLTRLLKGRYGKPVFPMVNRYKYNDLPKRGGPVFANISLPHEMRTSNKPDFYSHAPFVDEIDDLFAQTHETVKLLLKQQRGR